MNYDLYHLRWRVLVGNFSMHFSQHHWRVEMHIPPVFKMSACNCDLKFIFGLLIFTAMCASLKMRQNAKSCENVELLEYLNPPGPLTALASIPGSGCTWIRHLIQMATGIHTGTVYYESKSRIAKCP